MWYSGGMLKAIVSHFARLRSEKRHEQIAKYFVAGAFAFVADFGVMVFFKEVVGLHYLWANAIGFLMGTAVTYFLSIWWIFSKRHFWEKKHLEFGIFTLVGVVGLALTSLVMWGLTDFLLPSIFEGDYLYMISKIIATLMVFVWNFLVRKVILFR